MTTDRNLTKRNAYTAVALLLLVATWVPYIGEEKVRWMMWRDAPALAVCFAAAGIALFVASARLARASSVQNS